MTLTISRPDEREPNEIPFWLENHQRISISHIRNHCDSIAEICHKNGITIEELQTARRKYESELMRLKKEDPEKHAAALGKYWLHALYKTFLKKIEDDPESALEIDLDIEKTDYHTLRKDISKLTFENLDGNEDEKENLSSFTQTISELSENDLDKVKISLIRMHADILNATLQDFAASGPHQATNIHILYSESFTDKRHERVKMGDLKKYLCEKKESSPHFASSMITLLLIKFIDPNPQEDQCELTLEEIISKVESKKGSIDFKFAERFNWSTKVKTFKLPKAPEYFSEYVYETTIAVIRESFFGVLKNMYKTQKETNTNSPKSEIHDYQRPTDFGRNPER